MTPILQTDRLLIAQLTINDASFIFELTNSPGWLQYIGDRGIKTIADAENYIITSPMASYAKNGYGLYLVLLKENETPLGICGLIKRDTLENEDIGFAFLPQYTGKGYAYEAASAIMQYEIEKHKLKKILAITLEDNQPSVGLLKKLGLVFHKKITLPPKNEELLLFTTV
ncbi:MAG: GNAT family N-acetyltransferase [Chitinophagaceae bacterium]